MAIGHSRAPATGVSGGGQPYPSSGPPQLLETIHEYAILEIDLSGIVTGCNPGAEPITGFSPADIVGQPAAILFTPEDRERGAPAHELEMARITGRYEHERWRLRRDGTRFWASGVLSCIYNKTGEPAGFVKVLRDATAQKRAQDSLRESEQRLRLIVDNVKDTALMQLDPDARIVYWNPGAERIFGYSANEVLGRNYSLVFSDEAARDGVPLRDIATALENGRAEFELALYRKDGTPFLAHWVTEPIRDENNQLQGFVKVLRDESARERARQQLNNSQKMEALGRLAGGVAHDFNNLLTVIFGYTALLQQELSGHENLRTPLVQIQKAAERAARLTAQLLTFSRKHVSQPAVISLNDVLSGMEKLLSPLLGEDIELTLSLPARLGSVKADPGQIEQIVMNLAANARDAMPNGGELRIVTANERIDEDFARLHGLQPGPCVTLTVTDTGQGLDEATRAQVFEPFFTTKPSGKGTGLGLATSYGIAQQSGGILTVQSEPGRGATFKLYLPRVKSARASPAVPEKETRGLPESGAVLVVEDEASLRRLFADSLARAGYTVHEAPDGTAALHLASEISDPIDLLITDVVMPHLNGTELAHQLQPDHPEMRVLFVSGYTNQALTARGLLDTGARFLQKPFTLDGLLDCVNAIMREAHGDRPREPATEPPEKGKTAGG
jgi:PAS domain S-box-containing protein